MKLLLSPHNDDETLFAAYTIMREKPLVIILTDGHIQGLKGLKVTAEERIKETKAAMEILGAEVEFLHISDTAFTEKTLRLELYKYEHFYKKQAIETVYAPADQVGGHLHHNLAARVADSIWKHKVKHYTTYDLYSLEPRGNEEVKPTEKEMKLKRQALGCYKSQLKFNRPHFEAVYDKSEFFI